MEWVIRKDQETDREIIEIGQIFQKTGIPLRNYSPNIKVKSERKKKNIWRTSWENITDVPGVSAMHNELYRTQLNRIRIPELNRRNGNVS